MYWQEGEFYYHHLIKSGVLNSFVRPSQLYINVNSYAFQVRYPFSPQHRFLSIDPPSDQQIRNIIPNMRSSGSLCPLDQSSIISFKRCPYLRSYITEIITVVWSSGTLPHHWKKAYTVLGHKKGDTDDPGNFCQITLK